jgi:hypothetical protein
MDPVEVVSNAEADQVPFVIGPTLRLRDDVVRVHRPPAAAWDLAEVPVAVADPPLERPCPLQEVLVRPDEVRREGDQALFGPHPALRGRPERAEGTLQQPRGRRCQPDAELAPRAHLHLAAGLQLPAQLDAGQALALLDPASHLLGRGISSNEPGLFVAEPLLCQRLPQERVSHQPPLQRGTLRGRPLAHPQHLLAVVAEACEPKQVPAADRLEEHDQLAEEYVPAPSLLQVAFELSIQAPGVDLTALPGRLDGRRLRQVGPLRMHLLQMLLQRLEIVLRREHEVIDVVLLGSLERAHVLLAPGSDPLATRGRRLFEHHACHGQPEVEHLALLPSQLGAEVEPLLPIGIARGLHFGFQRADRPALGLEQPVRLVPLGHGRDDLGLAKGDHAPPDRLPDEGQVAEPPRQPLHLGRRAGVEAQLLPGVVASVAVPEVHRPQPDTEGGEPLADGHFEGPTAVGHVDERGVHSMRPLPGDRRITNPGQPPPETGDGGLELVELDLRFGAALAHDSSVATPPDISPWLIRPAGPTRRVER